ncbi:MAG: hypothetical protein IK034_00500 [Bacilli bacterium]|nr:hypothetical protein [Bacilli bacterium]MBR5990301.1 hypothetical protein [Bacilli bacterium]
MGIFVYQGDEEGCGLATLKMLLLDLTKKKGYRYLTSEKETDISLEDIRQIAFKEGVDIKWKRTSSKEELLLATSFPLLILLEGSNKGHLVYLKKGTKKKFLVYDPAIGKRWVKKEDFIKDFSCVYGEPVLFCVESCPYTKPKIFSKKGFFLSSLTSLLGIASLYFGLYLLGNEDSYIVVAILLSLYGLLSVGSRLINGFFSRRFDKRWLKYVPSNSKKKLAKNYERYYAFKSSTFPAVMTIVEGVSVVFGLSFLFGLNDPYFYVSAIGLSIYLALESGIFRKKVVKKKESLVLAEENLLQGKDNIREQLKKMSSISNKAFQIGEGATYVQIIYMAVAIGLAFIPSMMSENFTLNYFLFHFFGLLGLGQGIRSLLNFFENRSERERAYVYFLDNFVKKEDSR